MLQTKVFFMESSLLLLPDECSSFDYNRIVKESQTANEKSQMYKIRANEGKLSKKNNS